MSLRTHGIFFISFHNPPTFPLHFLFIIITYFLSFFSFFPSFFSFCFSPFFFLSSFFLMFVGVMDGWMSRDEVPVEWMIG